jgi:hypothetical protein
MTPKTLKIDIYQNEDGWQGTVHVKLGHFLTYTDGNTAGEVLDHIIKHHPGFIYDIEVLDQIVYNEITREEEDVFN